MSVRGEVEERGRESLSSTNQEAGCKLHYIVDHLLCSLMSSVSIVLLGRPVRDSQPRLTSLTALTASSIGLRDGAQTVVSIYNLRLPAQTAGGAAGGTQRSGADRGGAAAAVLGAARRQALHGSALSPMHHALATTTQLAVANTTLTPAWQPWASQLGRRRGGGRPAPRPNQPHAHPPCGPRYRRPAATAPEFQAKATGVGATRYQAAPSSPNSLASGNLAWTSGSGSSARRWRRCGPAHTGARRRKPLHPGAPPRGPSASAPAASPTARQLEGLYWRRGRHQCIKQSAFGIGSGG